MKSFSKFLCAAAMFAAVLVPATSKADEVTFTGSVKGEFNGGAYSSTTTYNTLTYYGSTFNNTTVGGMAAFGGDGVASTSNSNNFGAISLGSTAATYSSLPFALQILFTAPTGISTGQTTSFMATIMGNVSSTANGGILVSFSPATQSYTFANSSQTGSFTLSLNNLSIKPGQLASVTGTIFSSATGTSVTPEPNSLMLLGTGLVSTAGMLMRRRRNSNA